MDIFAFSNPLELFDVDLNSLSGKSEELVSLAIDHRSNSSIKLRYLDHPDFFFLARINILRSLGKLLGPKHGAIFVDEVISDFMEARLQIPKENKNPSSDDSFIGWLHEWIGSLIIAQEVLLGSFSATATTVQQGPLEHTQLLSMKKKEKRRNRILLSLASSILPLLVDSSLWSLPIENRFSSVECNANNKGATMISPQTLQRNRIVVVLLMEVIGIFCKLLQRDVSKVLSSILYPVVEKTIRRGPNSNSHTVQQTGSSTLKTMSLSCGFQSTENLIHAEQNRLIASLVGRLRLPGGSKVPKSRDDAEEILYITKISTWLIEMINRRIDMKIDNNQQIDDEKDIENISNTEKNSAIVDLLALLDYRLDHIFLEKSLDDADVEIVCSLHKAFFQYFLVTFKIDRELVHSYQMKNVENDSNQPWLDTLSQFRRMCPDSSEMDDGNDAKDNGGKILDVANADIALYAKLLARGCYLLSHQKLMSRISSCNAMTLAFKFLAFVGSQYDVSTRMYCRMIDGSIFQARCML